jgi:hypothetical protein
MNKTLCFASLAIFVLLATQARAVPAPMFAADIVEGQDVFPSVMPSLLLPEHSVVPINSKRYGSSHRLNLTCKFLTMPVYGALANRIEIKFAGYGSLPATFEIYDPSTKTWRRLGTRSMPDNPTTERFLIDITSISQALHYIDITGQVQVRMTRTYTRSFSYIMDFVGVNVSY